MHSRPCDDSSSEWTRNASGQLGSGDSAPAGGVAPAIWPPVDAVPAYMGVAVSSSIAKNGSTISGDITKIIVVVTGPGYLPNPGHPGTGTIIATYC